MNNYNDTNIILWGAQMVLWIFLGLLILVGILVETKKSSKITGRFRFKCSILLRIWLCLSGSIFLFFFDYKLALAVICFVDFFLLQNKWKNWGK